MNPLSADQRQLSPRKLVLCFFSLGCKCRIQGQQSIQKRLTRPKSGQHLFIPAQAQSFGHIFKLLTR